MSVYSFLESAQFKRSSKFLLPLLFLLRIDSAESQESLPYWESNHNPPSILLRDASNTHLPINTLTGNSMDAKPADLDNDGDLDLVIASEFRPNIILINDGDGHFANESAARISQPFHDSEDVGIADFDMDGDLDIIFVSEDDQINEFYLNDGKGFFSDASSRLEVTGTSNAVLVADIDGDGDPDIMIGNAGQNAILINDGNASFVNETSARLPINTNITQDLEWGDVDGDGDYDLIEGNENGNRLLVNDSAGVFIDATLQRLILPPSGEETREADLGDVDSDGDLDLFLANVAFGQNRPAQNRLLLNDGNGFFSDATTTHLPLEMMNTVDGDLVDIDADGDLDLLTAQAFDGTFQILLNDGAGVFTDESQNVFATPTSGNGIDVEAADYNGDGLLDLYLCGFGRADYLYLAEDQTSAVEEREFNESRFSFALEQSYPNPFLNGASKNAIRTNNSTTVIRYHLPTDNHVTLKIYNLLGREMRTLINQSQTAGRHSVVWDGKDNQRQFITPGVYLYRLQAGALVETKKLIMVE